MTPNGAARCCSTRQRITPGTLDYDALNTSKAGLRTLAQAMAKGYPSDGMHVAHIVIDRAIGSEKSQTRFPAQPTARSG